MLVDNPVSFLSPPPATMNNTDNDFSEFLNTELFASSSTLPPAAASSASSTGPGSPGHSSSSRASSPTSMLTTPPQQPLQSSFPEIQDDPYGFGSFGSSTSSSFFNFLDEEWKTDPSMGMNGLGGLGLGLGIGGSTGGGGGMGLSFGSGAYSTNAFAPSTSSSDYDFLRSIVGAQTAINSASDVDMAVTAASNSQQMAIDPQLVGTLADSALQDEQKESQDAVAVESSESTDADADSSTKKRAAKKASTPPQESTTLTITPVKVGGHGKSRKGTVQSGGVTKKHASSSNATLSTTTSSLPVTSTSSLLTAPAGAATPTTKNKENVSASKKAAASKAESIADDDEKDDDDLPADWRPPPEVFQKMTSKEKRQLRNKISARNFRVRRKEYISTLELDIAERDRLLQAIRSELGSTQSENLALRQEIAALKKALLEGRQHAISPHSPASTTSLLSPTMVKGAGEGMNVNLNAVNAQPLSIEDVPILNLPPPAPLPERSAAEELAARTTAKDATASSPSASSSSSLVTPNTQKDVSNAGQAAFWGGMSPVMGGVGFGGFGFGGGITPVHTVLMPELSSIGNIIGSSRRTEDDLSVSKWVRDVVAANEAALAERQAAEAASGIVRKRRLQENMNPTLNDDDSDVEMDGRGPPVGEFDNFVEGNAFTMKSMDAYRMQLWTKMAAQNNSNRHHEVNNVVAPKPVSPASSISSIPSPTSTNPKEKYHPDRISSPSPFVNSNPQYPSPYLTSPHLPYSNLGPKGNLLPSPTFNSFGAPRLGGIAGGLASQLKPHYFVNSNKPNLPSSPTPSSPRILSTLLAGKHSSPSASGAGAGKKQTPEQVRAQQQQMMVAAALATTASQTLLGRLGSAFWDAFSGGSSTSPVAAGAGKPHALNGGVGNGNGRTWDADKVRKVLEGKAVVRVVDLEDTSMPVKREDVAPVLTPSLARKTQEDMKEDSTCISSILEEKMKTLSLGKKN
ncbi:proteophosphoglycan ppg4 [Moniliophthora roreri MCA 2997]|uniref:Proteophosphoglycan ppg4 n=2 Tax=Moniliophthora roreri TaxID=221103 RepID=V2WSP6_MONRO|nr:proteophosphoglycan ppg4 [Moniliophthora roreri MCA 2997]KAI3612858.1 proteophosphoglycan ppg4 [Moniliophthora roreri]